LSRLATNSTTLPERLTVPLSPGSTTAALVPSGDTSSTDRRSAPGYHSSSSFDVQSPGATDQTRSCFPVAGTVPVAWMPSLYEFDAAITVARLGRWVSRRSMPCSTSVVPSWGPPLVPRLTLITQGWSPALSNT
jgi:hypothetical protein